MEVNKENRGLRRNGVKRDGAGKMEGCHVNKLVDKEIWDKKTSINLLHSENSVRLYDQDNNNTRGGSRKEIFNIKPKVKASNKVKISKPKNINLRLDKSHPMQTKNPRFNNLCKLNTCDGSNTCFCFDCVKNIKVQTQRSRKATSRPNTGNKKKHIGCPEFTTFSRKDSCLTFEKYTERGNSPHMIKIDAHINAAAKILRKKSRERSNGKHSGINLRSSSGSFLVPEIDASRNESYERNCKRAKKNNFIETSYNKYAKSNYKPMTYQNTITEDQLQNLKDAQGVPSSNIPFAELLDKKTRELRETNSSLDKANDEIKSLKIKLEESSAENKSLKNKCINFEKNNLILKQQNKKLYDIMYEILGVVKLKSTTNFANETSHFNSSFKFPELTEAKELDTLEYSHNKDELDLSKLENDRKKLFETQRSKEKTLDKYLVITEEDQPEEKGQINMVINQKCKGSKAEEITYNSSTAVNSYPASKRLSSIEGKLNPPRTNCVEAEKNITNLTMAKIRACEESHKEEQSLPVTSKREKVDTFVSFDHNPIMSAKSNNEDDLEEFNLQEQYFSRSEQKGKNIEDGITEKFQPHLSDHRTKNNIFVNVRDSASIYFGSETEKPQNFHVVNEDWENFNAQQTSRERDFSKINTLGERRRSQCYIKTQPEVDNSSQSSDYNIDVSPKNPIIDKIPVNSKVNAGMTKHNFKANTRYHSKIVTPFQPRYINYNPSEKLPHAQYSQSEVHMLPPIENLHTLEGDENVEFEFINIDQNGPNL
ncbi:unnamed protein product [Moneuplotes crassus]|uniref:Uncharacterized protein n=1 Tax=Euplotes crassus TaxID=5936 RepID=A0AAD2D814_EUPCR|nr:unnamed protein product [Moneuplotes crassus]